MKNTRTGSFFILTFLLSWLAWLPGMLLTNHYIQPNGFLLQLNTILNPVGGMMPSLVAFFLVYREQGVSGVKKSASRVFKLRLGYWYFPLFLIIPLCLVLAHCINIPFGHPFPDRQIFHEPWMILPLFLLFLVMVASEEFGWRGFALDKLQTKWSAFNSSIIIGSIWALWHIPMFLSNGFAHHDIPLPFGQLFITLVLTSVLITWLQNNTRSLAPAFIIHALINLSGEVLPLVDKDTETPGNYSQWIIINVMLAVVVIFIVKFFGTKTLMRDQKD